LVVRHESRAQAEQTHRGSAGVVLVQLGPSPVQLRFARPDIQHERAIPFLRLVNGNDHRGAHQVLVHHNQQLIARFDLRISAEWASFGLDLSPWLGDTVAQWPIELVLEVSAYPQATHLVDSLRPHEPPPALVVDHRPDRPGSAWVALPPNQKPAERAIGLLASPGGRDHLGWMLGCTALGLWDAWATWRLEEARQGLELLLAGQGEGFPLLSLAGELPIDTQNLESYLPLAALALWQQNFPRTSTQQLLRTQASRILHLLGQPRSQLTTEGAFTLAYPLSTLATALNQPDWYDLAAQEVLLRWKNLRFADGIAQRTTFDRSRRWMLNWARGIAWLLLGTVRVCQELPTRHPARPRLIAHLQQVWPLLEAQQQATGLWSVFTHLPTSGAETSGSAGLATALALAAREGWLPDQAWQAAQRCHLALSGYLEADGSLHGVSQHNPAGEEVLQLGYRIRAAWGSGLFLQLHAALGNRP
jgi:hypothetical protein